MAERCIFCDVASEALVYRGKDGIVIVDDPVRPGHVLVGARAHGESLSDISAEDAGAMMALANRAARAIVEQTGAEKVYVAAIGDKDRHFHVHLLPKMSGDPNLGPHIFGPNGWISFLDGIPDQHEVEQTNGAIAAALKSEK